MYIVVIQAISLSSAVLWYPGLVSSILFTHCAQAHIRKVKTKSN
jgi:hypothetical protein